MCWLQKFELATGLDSGVCYGFELTAFVIQRGHDTDKVRHCSTLGFGV